MKLMFIGAHPDDGDGRVAGLARRYVENGGEALFVSTTNGNAGHQSMTPAELARARKAEARAAGEVIGAEYVVLDHDDGRLTPSIEVREELIGMIRAFHPDLLVGLRPFDYHPDHRAAGQLVMDAYYMLTVPLIRPDVPHMEKMPVIVYVEDDFTRPYPFQADVVVAIDEYIDLKIAMRRAHTCQFFEWIPYNGGYLDEVPEGEEARKQWFRKRFEPHFAETADRFRDELIARYGPERGAEIRYAEAFEICEYGRRPDAEMIEQLFPM